MDQTPETFAEWRLRTSMRDARAWATRIALALVVVTFALLSASGHLGWAIVVALGAGATIWFAERAPRRPTH